MGRWLRSETGRLDLAGLVLVAFLALWVGSFAGRGAGSPEPVLALLLALVGTAALSRRLEASKPDLVVRLVTVGVGAAVVITWPGILQAGGGPLGYANANAALCSVGVVTSLAAARSAATVVARRAWLGTGLVLAGCTVASGSVGGVLTLAVALALLLLSATTQWAGFAVVGGLVAISLALGGTTAIALGSDLGGLAAEAGVRADLWRAAAELAKDDPLSGIGPGGFADRRPVSPDRDLRWAHHDYLQAAAEWGTIGFALIATLVAWAWTAMWRSAARSPAVASLTASAVTVVALHATVDYVAHLPPVLVAMTAVLAAGTRTPQRGRPSASEPLGLDRSLASAPPRHAA